MTNGIVAKSALNAAAGMSLLFVGFICSIVVARLLGPEANGAVAFALWLAMTGSLVAELGTGVILLRMLPQFKVQGFDDAARRGFAARLLRAVVLSTAVVLVGYVLAIVIAENAHWAHSAPLLVAITAILFFVQSIGSFAKNYLVGEQRMGTLLRLTTAAGLLQLLGVLAGAAFFGTEGALAGYIGGHILSFFYALGMLRNRPEQCGTSTAYLARSSFLLSILYLVDSVFLNRLELLFLQQFHGLTIVGYYAAAASLANLALQLPVQLSGSLVPYYSEQLQQQGGAKLPASVLDGVLRSLSYITLPMSFGLAAIAARLVEVVFGASFAPSGPILATLAISSPVYVFSLVLTQYMFSHDMLKERLIASIAAAVLMVVGSIVLVPVFAGEGAAVARMIVFMGMGLIILAQMKIGVSPRQLLMPLGRITLSALLCAVASYLVILGVPGVAGLVLAIVAGVIAYVVALRLLRVVPIEDRLVMDRIAERVPGRARVFARRFIAFVAVGPSIQGGGKEV